MSNEGVMFLPACWWNSDEDEHPAEALVTVEDALVIIFSSPSGVQLRLLLHEFTEVARFVADEVDAQTEEEEDDEPVCFAPI